jgi:hypothetical protein
VEPACAEFGCHLRGQGQEWCQVERPGAFRLAGRSRQLGAMFLPFSSSFFNKLRHTGIVKEPQHTIPLKAHYFLQRPFAMFPSVSQLERNEKRLKNK